MSRRPEFALVWIWYTSVAAVAMQMVFNLVLLQREFRQRLGISLVPGSRPAAT